jgi:4-amino-4-deoxy-L-arabinose transferase-like glycosyltransferase
MKSKAHTASKFTARPKEQAVGQAVPISPKIARLERLEVWLRERPRLVLGSLLACWIAIRLFAFVTVAQGPLYEMYRWQASDNYFFDQWARAMEGGDWLNRQPLHPYHEWHHEFADFYFKRHPEKLSQILAANPVRDSAFAPGKILWNEWYGGNTYHQEPFYAYALAVLYALSGNGVYLMLVLQSLLGVASGALLWSIARRHFGDTVALATGLMYLFCGIILFQELLILRTSWSVFFTLLTVWMLDRALEQRTKSAFFLCGLSVGLAFLLQSIFAVFLIAALAIYFLQERKNLSLFAQNAGLMALGFLLAFSPVALRNAVVGAPVFSSSSVGAVTFVASNVQGTKTVSSWRPEASRCAEIMGKTEGKFGLAAIAAVASHPSVGSYLALLSSKFQHIINGLEWPNNENYYFYKESVPVLRLAFFDFYWIAGLGVAGVLFSLYHRKKCRTLYWAMLVQLTVLLGFYVLGRFRTPLAALMLPFAAYALVECLRFSKNNLKMSLGKIAVAALCFYFLTYKSYQPGLRLLDTTDYNVLYDLAFYEKIKSNAEAQQWSTAIAAHAEFLELQPDFVKNAKPGQVLKSPAEVEVMNLFAAHHQIHGYLYEDSGNKSAAAAEMARHDKLKQIAAQSKKNLKK